jgi:hypothetical protein
MKIKHLQLIKVAYAALFVVLLGLVGMTKAMAQGVEPKVSNTNIVFADENVKNICVSIWDANGDGELSYAEAAAVTDLGWNFAWNWQITSFDELQFFTGLTTIGFMAFDDCGHLQSITIPNSVTYIDHYAFEDCYDLQSLTVLAVNPPDLGQYVFDGDNMNIPVYIPCGTVEAYQGWGGFNNIVGMCSGEVTASVNPQGAGTVAGTGVYDFDSECTLTAIANEGYNFVNWTLNGQIVSYSAEYTFLTKGDMNFVANFVPDGIIVFADQNVKNICVSHWDSNGDGELSFAEAAAVTDLEGAFQYNWEITTFDEFQYFIGLTSIEYNAFAVCGSLASILIPNSVTQINNEAFYYIGINSIVIPKSVEYIGSRAFSFCNNLEGIIVEPGNSVYDSRENSNAIIETASNTLIAGSKNTVIPNTVTSIGDFAFYGCGISSCTIPNSVTSIGYGAFSHCANLTSITIPNSVVFINSGVFASCDALEQMMVESGNMVYDSRDDCNAIIETSSNILISGCNTSYIPNTVTAIGSEAFSGMVGITSMTIPNSVTSIGYSAFLACYNLQSLTVLADNPPALDQYVFLGDNMGIPVYVPCGSEDAYNGWGGFNNIVGICPSEVTASVNPPGAGTVAGTGVYDFGSECTLTATANEGYSFANWTLNGQVVSYSAEYTFSTTGDMALVANFVPDGNIVFADENVKNICVSHWDTNNDGELSYAEAAAVRYLDGAFLYNMAITSFNELQYFIGLVVIGDNEFNYCINLTSVIIPSTVASINYRTFYKCGLTALRIPKSVTVISSHAFESCNQLEIISVDDENTVFDSRENCNAIIETASNTLILGCKNTFIPNTVQSIGDYAFSNCMGLSSVTIPSSVTSIGYAAFWGCTGLVSIVIPNTVSFINFESFGYCQGLERIVVEEGNTVYDSRENCNAIIESNSNTLLFGCKNTIIPNSVIGIFYEAFCGCVGLTSITIPNSVTSIDAFAFEDCTGLTSITIPASVTTISYMAFAYCSGLQSVTMLSETPPTYHGDDYFNESAFHGVNTDIPVYVPCGAEDAYNGWSGFSFNNIVGMCPGEVTASVNPQGAGTVAGTGAYDFGDECTLTATANGGYVFVNWTLNGHVVSNCAEYTFLTAGNMALVANFVPDGNIVFADENVKNICVSHWDTNGDGELSYVEAAAVTDLEGAFQYNWEITSFDEFQYFIGLAVIGNAFDYCGLTSVIIPKSVTSISYTAFSTCTGLETIVVDPENTVYDSRDNCNAIIETASNTLIAGSNNTMIPNTIVSIGDYAFEYRTGLTSVALPNALVSIGYAAFWGCSGLSSVTIPENVTYFGSAVFANCNGLEQITVDAGNTVFDSRENCNAVIETSSNSLLVGCKNTMIPNSVNHISSYAFYGCSGLTSIIIPNSVTYIDYWAFGFCSGLQSLEVLCETPPALGMDAFYYYDYNTEIPVYVPCGSEEAYINENWGDFNNILGLCDGWVSTEIIPAGSGSATGTGMYQGGASCTLTAVPNEGYAFVNWTFNGRVVSTSAEYTFPVAGDMVLMANFIVSDSDGYVDLGLPSGTLWAACNLGAETPEGYGDRFAWGETQPKDEYDWDNYQYYQYSDDFYYQLTKYCNESYYGYNGFTDNLNTLLPEDDAASVNWGSAWRMPTKEEFEELCNNTTYILTSLNGVRGLLFTGSNDNKLFLPVDEYSSYWSSSLYTEYPYSAWCYNLYADDYYTESYMSTSSRCSGIAVRPVRSASQNLSVQDIHLSEGWNWFSSYITYDENSFGYMTDAIGDMVTTSVIKSQTEFTSLDVSGWSGTLDDLQNQNMYMILVGGDIDISLNGALVNPAAVPITLSSGWNWMVYLPNVTMSLEQGLANLEPVDGDMIKSQSGFSSYNSDEGGWVGTLNLLKPGEGYAYLNNSMEDKTLVYPYSSKGAVAENTEKRHFSYNCHRFMSNMTLMVTLDASEFDLGKGSHEIAAFVGDDCRGSARLMEVNGQYIAFVTVGGEDVEEVTFRLFDVNGGEVYPEVAQEKLRYATDAVYGSLKEPFKLHFKGAGVEETEAMLRVSPNPVLAHGEVRLGLPTAEKVRVEIYSALGIKVMSEETSDGRVVLSPAVVPGTYIMKVASASGAGHYCKLIVE